MKLSGAQQGVLLVVALIAFLELGVTGRFSALWGLAFDPKKATPATPPGGSSGGGSNPYSQL